MKDLVLHNTTITPGYLAKCAAAIEPLTRPFDLQLVQLRVVEHVTRGLEQLDRFGTGVSRLPERELDLKVKFLRTEFNAATDPCLAFLGNYNHIFDKVDDSVRPLMGLISFDAGRHSDFYARWFPGMNNLLARDNLIAEYATAVERLQAEMAVARNEEGDAVKQSLRNWLTPAVPANVEAASPHIRHFVSDGLVEVLASAFVFLSSLSSAPSWFHELERRIFHDIDEKANQMREVIAAGKD